MRLDPALCKYIFLFSILIFSSIVQAQENHNAITIIDVGEGDSILLQSSGKTALIDTGNLKSAPKILAVLAKSKIKKIDYLIFTHPHPDHIGGGFGLISHLEISEVFDNGEDLTAVLKKDPTVRWYQELFRDQLKAKSLNQGAELKLGDFSLSVIWPPKNGYIEDWNSNSLVILVQKKEFRLLLMGDANLATEKKLLNNIYNPFLEKLKNVDLIKAGHHAAVDTADNDFINFIKPKITLVSVNSNNINNYPSSKTLDRYLQIPSKIFRTDLCDNININFSNSNTYQVSAKCQ